MDKLLRFCIQRDPQILLYQAALEIVEDLTCPVDNREALLEQLVAPDSEAGERAEIATLAAELFPAYLFPMSSKQNALEKFVEAVESYLDPKHWRGGGRMVPDPHDPDRCRRDCWKAHKMRTLALMDMELHGEKLMRAMIKEIRSLHQCLANCAEEHIPVEPYRKAPQAFPYPQPHRSPQPSLPYELIQYPYELSAYPYGWPSHPLLHIVEVQPDYNEFAHLHNSAIWVTFDQPVKASTVTEETFVVYDEAAEMRVDGTRTISNNGKTAVFQPNGDYPGCDAPNGTNITVRLVGTDVGLGAIESGWGVALDGNENGSPGGDFVTVYAILG